MLQEQRYGLMVDLVLTFDFTFVRSLYSFSFVLRETYALIMPALLIWSVLGCLQSCLLNTHLLEMVMHFVGVSLGIGVICFKRMSKS